MRIWDTNLLKARAINRHGSSGATFSPILHDPMGASLARFRLEPDGLLGVHEAAQHQLFLVVDGDGFVASGDDGPVEVVQGRMIFWARGEFHGLKAGPQGLVGYVLEGFDVAQDLMLGLWATASSTDDEPEPPADPGN